MITYMLLTPSCRHVTVIHSSSSHRHSSSSISRAEKSAHSAACGKDEGRNTELALLGVCNKQKQVFAATS